MYIKSYDKCNAGEARYTKENLTRGGKIFLALIHDDKKNVSSMHNVFKRYEHFKGVKKIESMIFCDNIEDLDNKFNESWENKNSVDLKKIDQQRNHILYNDEKSYQTRLTELINQVLE